MKRVLLSICAAALIVMLGGCTLQLPDPVVLGAIYSLTGGQAGLDIPSAQGAQLAVAEANAAGGVLGRPVQLVLMDGATAPVVVAQAADEIMVQHRSVTALFGLSDTDLVLAAAPVAAAQERLFVTSGATSPQLPAAAPGFLYLACFGDNVQAAAGAEWAYQALGARTAVVLYRDGSTYTKLLQGYFETRFAELGGSILAKEQYVPDDEAGLATAAERLPSADMVYLAATPDDALPGVQALRAAGFAGPILGGDGLDVAGLWEAHPEISQVYYTTHAYLGADNGDPRVAAFRAAYAAAYPDTTPDAFAALGYDTVNLLLAAVRAAGSSAPDAVRQALAGTRVFEGVTGRISFLPDSQIPVKSVTILAADSGRIRLVEAVTPQQVPAP